MMADAYGQWGLSGGAEHLPLTLTVGAIVLTKKV